MLTPTQLQKRQHGIGGSEVAAVLGISPWLTPLELYLKKTNFEEQVLSPPDNPLLEAGHRLEPFIANWYEEVTGNKVVNPEETSIHPEYPFLIGHIDRLIPDDNKLLEIKFCLEYSRNKWGEPGTDEIPLHYITQVQHYLALTGCDFADVAVLFGGWDLKIYTVKRNGSLIAKQINRCKTFWEEHVLKKIPPEPTTAHDFSLRYPNDNGDFLEANTEVIKTIDRLKALKANKKDSDEEIKTLEDKIKSALGEHSGFKDNQGNKLITWNTVHRCTLNSQHIKQAHPEIYQQFSKQSSARSIRLY